MNNRKFLIIIGSSIFAVFLVACLAFWLVYGHIQKHRSAPQISNTYKVIINLKPFNNDEKNVDIRVNGNQVTVSAKYESKNQTDFRSSQYYQTFTLPEKVDIKDIKLEKHGNNLIIIISKSVQPLDQHKAANGL